MTETKAKQKPGLQLYVIIGGIIVSVASVIITQFVVLPLKDRMGKDAAIRADYPYLQKEVVALKSWQAEMQNWKEQVLASGALNTQLRTVMYAMPEAPAPAAPPAAADTGAAKFVPTHQLMQRINR